MCPSLAPIPVRKEEAYWTLPCTAGNWSHISTSSRFGITLSGHIWWLSGLLSRRRLRWTDIEFLTALWRSPAALDRGISTTAGQCTGIDHKTSRRTFKRHGTMKLVRRPLTCTPDLPGLLNPTCCLLSLTLLPSISGERVALLSRKWT